MRPDMLRSALLVLALASTAMTVDAGAVDPQRRVEEALAEPRLSDQQRVERLVAVGSKATPHLCTLLAEQRDSVPVGVVARALGRIGGTRAVDALADLLASEDAGHRESAAAALGETGREEAIEPVMLALGDADTRVRFAAVPSLVHLVNGKPAHGEVRDLVTAVQNSEHKEGYAFALARLDDKKARGALLDLLGSRSDDVVLAALSGLWDTPLDGDGPEIHDLLYLSSSADVAKKACLLLGRLRYAPAARELIDLLYENDEGLVKNAHWALIQITGHRIVADTELWETWWERVGSHEADRKDDPEDDADGEEAAGSERTAE